MSDTGGNHDRIGRQNRPLTVFGFDVHRTVHSEEKLGSSMFVGGQHMTGWVVGSECENTAG